MQYFNSCRKISYLKTGIDEREYSSQVYQRLEKLELYKQLIREGCSKRMAFKVINIPKSTYYRLKKRYSLYGLPGLEYESKRPNKVRTSQWSTTLELYVRLLRNQYPLYGKYKIAVLLKREHNIEASVSTVGRVLKKLVMRGIVKPVSFYYGRTKIKRRRVFNKHAQRWAYGMKAKKLGELIQIDHLVVTIAPDYHVRHFTATCPITRLTVEQVYSRATCRSASDFLEYIRNQLPYPILSIQVDGGSEFMGEFEQTCKNLNIQLYVLPPRSPKFNGAVERRNQTARYEFYSLYEGDTILEEIRSHLKQFMRKYNTFRPHQSLQYQTPWQYYLSLGA
jgi:transposase InsO family protein